ncbi:MAG: hypothetical protein OEV42_21240, partial [Deltaproteobacteria bacterium]|nr:hypothetical protein [Deltaproteobacteria bacterium]
ATPAFDPFGLGAAARATPAFDPFGLGAAARATPAFNPFGLGAAARATPTTAEETASAKSSCCSGLQVEDEEGNPTTWKPGDVLVPLLKTRTIEVPVLVYRKVKKEDAGKFPAEDIGGTGKRKK